MWFNGKRITLRLSQQSPIEMTHFYSWCGIIAVFETTHKYLFFDRAHLKIGSITVYYHNTTYKNKNKKPVTHAMIGLQYKYLLFSQQQYTRTDVCRKMWVSYLASAQMVGPSQINWPNGSDDPCPLVITLNDYDVCTTQLALVGSPSRRQVHTANDHQSNHIQDHTMNAGVCHMYIP